MGRPYFAAQLNAVHFSECEERRAASTSSPPALRMTSLSHRLASAVVSGLLVQPLDRLGAGRVAQEEEAFSPSESLARIHAGPHGLGPRQSVRATSGSSCCCFYFVVKVLWRAVPPSRKPRPCSLTSISRDDIR